MHAPCSSLTASISRSRESWAALASQQALSWKETYAFVKIKCLQAQGTHFSSMHAPREPNICNERLEGITCRQSMHRGGWPPQGIARAATSSKSTSTSDAHFALWQSQGTFVCTCPSQPRGSRSASPVGV